MNGFVSYAHDDHLLVDDFRRHLKAIQRTFGIEFWTDGGLKTGERWETKLLSKIENADIFVLLLSPSFISSDFIFDREVPAIKKRRDAGNALVMPVLLRRCSWQMICGGLQAAPTENGCLKPVTSWHRRDHAFDTVRQQLEEAIASYFGLSRENFSW